MKKENVSASVYLYITYKKNCRIRGFHAVVYIDSREMIQVHT